MKFLLQSLFYLFALLVLMEKVKSDNSAIAEDTKNAIDEIEQNLKEIENDNSLPAQSEHENYQEHFKSHQNSLDSISDFDHGTNPHSHSSKSHASETTGNNK